MRSRSSSRWLLAIAGAALLGACGPARVNEPPPQNPGSSQPSADGGLPVVPLTRRGVIVPSDVNMSPGASGTMPTTTPTTGAASGPTVN